MKGVEILKRVERYLFLEMCYQSYKSDLYNYYESGMNFVNDFIDDEENLLKYEECTS